MISTDDVIMAYRLILGREPENADAVATWAASTPDLRSLRSQFLNSEEFLNSHVVRLPVSLDWAAESRIDVNVPAGLLHQMLDRVAKTWQGLGSTQPFWSVLSSDEYKMERFDEHADTYWESGKGDVDRLNAWLKRNGIPAFGGNHSCCEYGCGTGRVTRWLADQFSHVVAFDISLPHIELAQSHMKRSGKSNVSFRHIDSLAFLNQKMQPVDVFFSFIVLQHNPPPIIAVILNTVLQCLKPGGVAFFQVPTYSRNYSFIAEDYLQHPSQTMEMHILPQRYVQAIASRQNCEMIEVQPDLYVGSPDWISNTFLLRKKI
jgi:2-polyprenyl-3-methyl-5-hydroxy-6-metoxy-1,4-benzoquinol methylase